MKKTTNIVGSSRKANTSNCSSRDSPRTPESFGTGIGTHYMGWESNISNATERVGSSNGRERQAGGSKMERDGYTV